MSERGVEKDAGLLSKYEVTRLGDQVGKHDECRFFVLDPQHDPLAVRALRVYASAANEAGYVRLAVDLWEWADKAERTRVTPPTEASS